MNNPVPRICGWTLLLCCANLALGQQSGTPTPSPSPAPTSPAAKSSPQIEAGEPRANSLPSPDEAPAAQPAAAEPPASAAPRRVPPPPKPAAAQKGAVAADRLNLNAATVTGDREQPKVMYVVPWKSPNIGDLSGKPMNSLLDEALAPVDRAEFKREVAYYDAVRGNAPKKAAAADAAKQVER